MGYPVYICNARFTAHQVGGSNPPWIGTYAIYHGADLAEVLFPNDAKIRELCAGKEIVNKHPSGEFYEEIRPDVSVGGSDGTTATFLPLDKKKLEIILELTR